MNVSVSYQPVEDADYGCGCVGTPAECWIAESHILAETRPPLLPCDRAGLLRLEKVARELGMPLRVAQWRPGDLLWWPTAASGHVSLYASPGAWTTCLIDTRTGHWRLRGTAWEGWTQITSSASGDALWRLVALLEEVEGQIAAERLLAWAAQAGAPA